MGIYKLCLWDQRPANSGLQLDSPDYLYLVRFNLPRGAEQNPEVPPRIGETIDSTILKLPKEYVVFDVRHGVFEQEASGLHGSSLPRVLAYERPRKTTIHVEDVLARMR